MYAMLPDLFLRSRVWGTRLVEEVVVDEEEEEEELMKRRYMKSTEL